MWKKKCKNEKVKKNVKIQFFDVSEVLDPHTRGVKIFVYIFCIFSHPQKANTAKQKKKNRTKYHIIFSDFPEQLFKSTG